jgi:hypothetical protein
MSNMFTKSGVTLVAVSTAPVRMIWNGAATSGSQSTEREFALPPAGIGELGVALAEPCPFTGVDDFGDATELDGFDFGVGGVADLDSGAGDLGDGIGVLGSGSFGTGNGVLGTGVDD